MDYFDKYFKPTEFTMDYGRVNVFEHMDKGFLSKIGFLRHIVGFGLSPSSSWRSEEFNKKIGGSEDSMHKLGRAVDFPWSHWNQEQRIKFITTAIALGLTVGIRKDIVHIDDREHQTIFGY